MQCKENILKVAVEWRRVRKMCVIQRKTGRVSEKVSDMAKVLIEHYNGKSHKPFRMTRKSFAGIPTPVYGRLFYRDS